MRSPNAVFRLFALRVFTALASPFLAVTVLASPVPEATELDAVRLPNDCFVKSVAFLHRYLAAHPSENGEMLVVSLPGNYGHALAVFSAGGEVLVYDHELGPFETAIKPSDYSAARQRRYITERYQERINWAKDDVRAGRRDSLAVPVRTEEEHARLAARLLGPALKATLVRLDEGAHYGVIFGFDRSLWVYVPSAGTARIKPSPSQSLTELTRTAVLTMGLACDRVEQGS